MSRKAARAFAFIVLAAALYWLGVAVGYSVANRMPGAAGAGSCAVPKDRAALVHRRAALSIHSHLPKENYR